MNKNTCYLYSVCVNQIKVPLFSFQNFQRSNKRSCKDQASVTTRWQSRDILLENALQKAVQQKVFENEVFLRWSKSSTKAFLLTHHVNSTFTRRGSWNLRGVFVITVNIVKKLNGLKLILHFSGRYNKSSFKCNVPCIPWVKSEKVWHKLFLNPYRSGNLFFT